MFTTFVINLDKDTERLSFMRDQLDTLGMPFLRQPGVYGKTYVPTKAEYDPELARTEGGHELLPGEIGCALSHAQVIATIVHEQLPYALILEDDVTLPTNFKTVIERELERNKQGDVWEYLLFDYIPVGRPFLRVWFRGIKYNFGITRGLLSKAQFVILHLLKALYVVPLSLFEGWREYWLRNDPGTVRFFRPVYFAGAYLVTLAGAQKLHRLSTPVRYTADHLPNKARQRADLRFRGYCPLIVKQEKETFGSSILDLPGDQI